MSTTITNKIIPGHFFAKIGEHARDKLFVEDIEDIDLRVESRMGNHTSVCIICCSLSREPTRNPDFKLVTVKDNELVAYCCRECIRNARYTN